MNTIKGLLNSSLGQNGLTIASAGTYTSHTYISILALEESVVTAVGNSIDDFTSITIPTGVNIPGNFNSITIVSGKCVLYKGV